MIIISSQTPEQRDRSTVDDRKAMILASWDVGLFGLDWLTALVQDGKARQLSGDGYPNRYTARAADVLPLLAHGVPPNADPHFDPGRMILHQDRVAACPADQVLTIDAWDQS
ncbi:hypothetical protein [Streptomyces sp. NBC_01565]|uniref:hypothetical protein n=1 Tax=unclassified Streptomyces TaxID=2593676 RepID=UPI0022543E85|nr:hypothetical protein [Streptomyces sp. NBC_01565]MCX4545920.1 hypothetical protein [Streptomyces sp. NBC_01565]